MLPPEVQEGAEKETGMEEAAMEEAETLAESAEVTEEGNHTKPNTTCHWSCSSLHCMEKMHTAERPFLQCHCRHLFDASRDLCSTHLRPSRCCSDRCYWQRPRWRAEEKKVVETVAETVVETRRRTRCLCMWSDFRTLRCLRSR
jgi:hypothetical protein